MKSLLIIPVLILFLGIAGLTSCAEDEVLLPSDSTYMGLIPVEHTVEETRAFSDYVANRYLKISREENRILFMADSLGLFQLTEVVVPEGENFESGTYNFGWPVATKNGSSIVISTQRMLLPGQMDDNSGKGQLLIISEDGGESWATPIEVQNLQPYGYRVGSQSCIGTFDGKFIQKGSGTMISENQGVNWNPYPRAFKFVTQEEYGANGPRIHDHPDFGLIFFTGTTGSIESGSVFRSDDGTSWEDSYWNTVGTDQVNCPGPSALVLSDGSILMLASNGRNMVQYLYEFASGDSYDDITFSVDTIESINTSLSAYDVPDLFHNPVSGKIEMVESSPAAILIWSMDETDLMNGSTEWQSESVLLLRDGLASMHPAGSVVDAENQLQHLYLYMGGEFPDRNCIYQLSRTLDTEVLSDWLNTQRDITQSY